MPSLPHTIYLARRRGAGDDAWHLVDGPAAASYSESPAVWEVEQRCRPAALPAESRIARDVEEFTRAMGGVIGEAPGIRKPELTANLIGEEACETLGAILGMRVQFVIDPSVRSESGRSLVAAIDGLCDLLATIFGAALTFGVDLMDFWPEIHRTNMTKVGGPHRHDGKQLKPDGWRPPDIAGLLAERYGEEALRAV